METQQTEARERIGAIQRNLADARAVVEHAERRRQALTVPAASDEKAARELEALHRDIAAAKQRISDLMEALGRAEATEQQMVEAARRELVAAQLQEIDEACVAEAARFDRALAEAVAAGESLDELHQRRLELSSFGGVGHMGQVEQVRGRNRLLAALPPWLLKIANPLVWPSGYFPLAESEHAVLGMSPAPTSKAAA